MERAILDLPGWSDNCQLAYSVHALPEVDFGSGVPPAAAAEQSACASPLTVLNILHRNDAKHKEQCARLASSPLHAAAPL